jgi:hypothetical protein
MRLEGQQAERRDSIHVHRTLHVLAAKIPLNCGDPTITLLVQLLVNIVKLFLCKGFLLLCCMLSCFETAHAGKGVNSESVLSASDAVAVVAAVVCLGVAVGASILATAPLVTSRSVSDAEAELEPSNASSDPIDGDPLNLLENEAANDDEGEDDDEDEADAGCARSDAGTERSCSSDSSDGNDQPFDLERYVHGVPCSNPACRDPTMVAGAATNPPHRCNVDTGQRNRRKDSALGPTRQYFCNRVAHAEGDCTEKAKWAMRDRVIACEKHAHFIENGANVSPEAAASLHRRQMQSAQFLLRMQSSALRSNQKRPQPCATTPTGKYNIICC